MQDQAKKNNVDIIDALSSAAKEEVVDQSKNKII
jgi:hypothetical protein